MNREEFIRDCDGLEKLVRTEFGYNQENMSEILGISKKRWWKLKREDPVWDGAEVSFFAVCFPTAAYWNPISEEIRRI